MWVIVIAALVAIVLLGCAIALGDGSVSEVKINSQPSIDINDSEYLPATPPKEKRDARKIEIPGQFDAGRRPQP
jgi:hypothetical protein